MLEKRGIAVEAGRQTVEVEVYRDEIACRQCSAGKVCGAGLFTQIRKQNPARIKAVNNGTVKAGDEVILRVPEQALLREAFISCIMPLLCMFLFAWGYERLAGDLLPFGESFTAAAGFSGLALGLFCAKLYVGKTRLEIR
ncbi:MAG: SoxR reducing system RseC family protein [Gammaproteobacteria bacterium]|nr:SoxR reducing system RseC family protein [Gammaproteobacteria bacterium]